MSATELLQRALELPEDQRTDLAYQILHSIKSGPNDPEWEESWMEEIERRATRYERGETKAEDAFAALEQIQQSLRMRRKP